MKDHLKQRVIETTGASDLFEIEKIQDLWSGYGTLKRYGLKGADIDSVVVKHVCLPDRRHHPRGWNTDISHKRKLRSYQVEMAWYRQWSYRCGDQCYVPRCFALQEHENETFMVLEDLKAVGFEKVKRSVNLNEIKVCLKWLATFHATFLGDKQKGLWKSGTYWHLQTRPDELKVLEDVALKNAAQEIDNKLNQSPFQTFVHGDAKLANFCFSHDGQSVAAVDFQYVGAGCGMKDVAYFVSSCLSEEDCEELENELLDCYFAYLKKVIIKLDKKVDTKFLEDDWRALYHVAWADFHRFLKGWSPGHWKINSYSERVTKKVVESL